MDNCFVNQLKKFKKYTSIALAVVFTFSFTLNEKEIYNYSELNEWGLSENVKVLKAFYYKNFKKNEKNPTPVDNELWERMSLTYYNKQGMIDSVKVFNTKNSIPILFINFTEGEIIKTYLVSSGDTSLFSIKSWKSKFDYYLEILNDTRVESKEIYNLDEKYRLKEIKREHYNLENNSIELYTREKFYFNENNHIDSIRVFSDGKLNNLTLNFDVEFDQNKNPIKTLKKIGKMEPYLIIREFTYY